MKTILLPPESLPESDGTISGGWWHSSDEDDRVICDLCPRECHMKPGDRGFCFVRQNVDGEMKLTTYGRSTGFCIDPIEKKPLNHFYPGTSVLSFGTAGCNLGCQFCQNWDISKSREVARLSELALPEMIANAAVQTGCRSVAYTYNDPVIWAEYAIDTAKACRQLGVKSVAVTAGYITPQARPAFFHAMDAANVDLKAFSEDFYHQITYSHLEPVLETLRWLKHDSDVWFEITNLLIPDANDSPDELRRMCDWVLQNVGPDVPIHFTAFHPDFRMRDRGHTPHEKLLEARQIAMEQGVRFVYVGNVHDVRHQSTWCPSCGELLIERDWHLLGTYRLEGNHCGKCRAAIPGHFDRAPGTWGRRRMPIQISDYAASDASAKSAAAELPLGQEIKPKAQTEACRGVTGNAYHTLNSVQKSSLMMPSASDTIVTREQENAVHQAACEIVAAAVTRRQPRLADPTLQGAADLTVMGVFVTLKRAGQLRGCCGIVGQPTKLLPAVMNAGMRTAAEDHRFPPVSPVELPFLTLDVTLLSNFQSVTVQGEGRVAEVEAGKHGLKITRGNKSGLLLPSVASERGWDARTFLNQVCRKAGLPVTAWQQPDAQLVRFEGKLIERAFDSDVLASISRNQNEQISDADLDQLARFARSNISALLRGAVPQCFPANGPDGTVDGLALRVSFPEVLHSAVFSQVQLRHGFPLQTTLLRLTESAARWLQTAKVDSEQWNRMQIDLILLSGPAMHGPVESVDLRGLDPEARAVMVLESQRSAWRFERNATKEDLVQHTVAAAKVRSPAVAQVFSFAARSTAAEISNANVPRPQSGTDLRPAAVAGRFYPSNPAELNRTVDECLGDIPAVQQPWPAVMVPHAGLQFSGRIAGGVLKRIELPDTIIVIGPRHTRQGVEWAVAPHARWQLPGASMAADPELAKRLCAGIDGLELDAAAHAQEHGIEVELPLLARLAPNSRVVGITIGAGDLRQCQRFGRQLADVLSELTETPLLVISSDMNHFASDDENRRLDELALSAMETLDPATLYETVTTNGVSMCGVLPAVIVMETLRCRNQLSRVQRAGYGTSGDVTGEKDRVVGYAGMLLG